MRSTEQHSKVKNIFRYEFFNKQKVFRCFENSIKIEQNNSNVKQHIGVQLILIDDYRLLILCFHLMTSFEYVRVHPYLAVPQKLS